MKVTAALNATVGSTFAVDPATTATPYQELKLAEATLNARNILVVLNPLQPSHLQASGLDDFFGIVVYLAGGDSSSVPEGNTLFICGDLAEIATQDQAPSWTKTAERIMVIQELSSNHDPNPFNWPIVDLGKVPIQVGGGMGVLYRRFFPESSSSVNYFQKIQSEHNFQALTESNKPGLAHRTGLYLTDVQEDKEGNVHFRILRCSTNLAGPTETFRETDQEIVKALNDEASRIFHNHALLNHVLAQMYHNNAGGVDQKPFKAKIKDHADKTKDMPWNGTMAFCTFYDKLHPELKPLYGNSKAKGKGKKATEWDIFDLGRGVSCLTTLRFRLKADIRTEDRNRLPETFTVKLYPNSVFFMPLSTNRFYTHEIRPSPLDPKYLPTRLGYVVRCSNTEAVHSNGQTYIKTHGGQERLKLEQPTNHGVAKLRRFYAEENIGDSFMDYGDEFHFSMNQGDYMRPDHRATNDFRVFTIPDLGIFKELMSSVSWENTGKGRQGAVLVEPDKSRGVPIVRTTTEYSLPAHCFQPVHRQLAKMIQDKANLRVNFNNGLIENYDDRYTTMVKHTDQALDLEPGTSIAVYSCYDNPSIGRRNLRKLIVETKGTKETCSSLEIPMPHNSVVVFSLDTNSQHRHKIHLDKRDRASNRWLGVTFRTSKTFIQHGKDGVAKFENGAPLTAANKEQRDEFYSLRRRENLEIDFSYPSDLTWTISASDLLPPIDTPRKAHPTTN